jgi:WhiB family redox-sensing transcriptional regulator
MIAGRTAGEWHYHRTAEPAESATVHIYAPIVGGPIINRTVLACQQQDPGLWISSVPSEPNPGRAFYRGCPKRQPWLAGPLEWAEPAGVWGGEIFENGRIIESKRPRGRPRKTTLAGQPGSHDGPVTTRGRQR